MFTVPLWLLTIVRLLLMKYTCPHTNNLSGPRVVAGGGCFCFRASPQRGSTPGVWGLSRCQGRTRAAPSRGHAGLRVRRR